MKILLCLSLVAAYEAGSGAPECPDGTASYFQLAGSALNAASQTAMRGAFVGWRSGRCDTPVTPAAITFQIWSYIYTQTSVLYTGVLDDHARFHLMKANEKTSEWLRVFTADVNTSKAADLLRDTRCHLDEVREHVCESNSFACCAASQFSTWVHVATLLSEAIAQRYGGGTCERTSADLTTVRRTFGDAVGRELDLLSVDRRDRGRTMELTVWAWAYKGICRNDGCPPVKCDQCDEVFAAIRQMSGQSDLAFATSLKCV